MAVMFFFAKLGELMSDGTACSKNLRLQMGRCPVRSIFPEALVLLEKKQHLLG